ncbi:hypothetical protein C0991_007152 [Blastosporella zonata]|nr:hypothetical protein C0991_007152 [Blastosporella zonata]
MVASNDDAPSTSTPTRPATPSLRPATPQPGTSEATTRPTKRKRFDAYAGGQPQKGQDYWSAVDNWFRTKTKDWGNNWSSPQWESYINSTIQWDTQLFMPDAIQAVAMVTTSPVLTCTVVGPQPANGALHLLSGSTSSSAAGGDRMANILAAY